MYTAKFLRHSRSVSYMVADKENRASNILVRNEDEDQDVLIPKQPKEYSQVSLSSSGK